MASARAIACNMHTASGYGAARERVSIFHMPGEAASGALTITYIYNAVQGACPKPQSHRRWRRRVMRCADAAGPGGSQSNGCSSGGREEAVEQLLQQQRSSGSMKIGFLREVMQQERDDPWCAWHKLKRHDVSTLVGQMRHVTSGMHGARATQRNLEALFPCRYIGFQTNERNLEWEESASIQMMKLYISQKTGKVGMPAAFVCRPAILLDASRILVVSGAAAEVVNMHRQCMASCVTTCIRSKVTSALRTRADAGRGVGGRAARGAGGAAAGHRRQAASLQGGPDSGARVRHKGLKL